MLAGSVHRCTRPARHNHTTLFPFHVMPPSWPHTKPESADTIPPPAPPYRAVAATVADETGFVSERGRAALAGVCTAASCWGQAGREIRARRVGGVVASVWFEIRLDPAARYLLQRWTTMTAKRTYKLRILVDSFCAISLASLRTTVFTSNKTPLIIKLFGERSHACLH